MRMAYSIFIPLLVLLLSAGAVLAAGRELVIQVQSVQLRAAPSFTGKPVGFVFNGQKVTVQEERDPWFLVSGSSRQGWLHKSAAAENRLSLFSGSQDAAARTDERTVSMAGKGFDKETEQGWRKDNPNGYAGVDKMLRYSYSPEESAAFLYAGRGQ
ncbi:MAG: SH3 domain-containing protein [Desulfovibrionaceae bacterium]|nr:SH3 domain-containing protein [Desulfovibrionaceae bacterium]